MAKILPLLLSGCCLLSYVTAKSYTIRNYDEGPGLYYETIGKANIYVKDFNIITYYDLEMYSNNYENLTNYVETVRTICKKLDNPNGCEDFDKLYGNILEKLEYKHDLIGDTIGINGSSHGRKKRSWTTLLVPVIEGIFGIIDTSIKENTVAKEVEKYRAEVNYLEKMVENQMFLYENLQRDVNNKFEEISGSIDKILSNIDIIHININTLSKWVEINTLIQYANALLQLFSVEQSDLLDCLIMARQGVLHPMIVSVEMLRKRILDVKNIAKYDSHMDNLLRVAGKNANKIFNMIKPVIYRKNKLIIFNFKVPLIAEAHYDIYKLTSAPVLIIQDVYAYIYPERPYLFVDRKNERHFFLDNSELDECKIAGDKLYLCERVKPLRMKTLTCEHKLLSDPSVIPNDCDVRLMHVLQPLFLELEQDGSWVFVAPNSEKVHMYCDQDLHRTSITGTGILSVNATCRNTETDALVLRDYSTNNLNLPYSFETFTPKANLKKFVEGTNLNYLHSYMNIMALSRRETEKLKEIGVPFTFLQMANREYGAEKLQSTNVWFQKQLTGGAISFNQTSYITCLLFSLLIINITMNYLA